MYSDLLLQNDTSLCSIWLFLSYRLFLVIFDFRVVTLVNTLYRYSQTHVLKVEWFNEWN